MILKFNLSLFYVLHLNTSLNLPTISMLSVYKKNNLTYMVYTDGLKLLHVHVQSRDISIHLVVTTPFE